MMAPWQIDGAGPAVAALAVALAVAALAKALFASFLMNELVFRLMRRDKATTERIRLLNWEIQQRRKWVPDPNSPHSARIELSELDVKARMREFNELATRQWPLRALFYFASCGACQCFWAAVIIGSLTMRPLEPVALLMAALSHSAVALWLQGRIGILPEPPALGGSRRQRNEGQKKGGCGS